MVSDNIFIFLMHFFVPASFYKFHYALEVKALLILPYSSYILASY